MGLPFKLKNFMLFKDGNNFQGEIESVTLPKLTPVSYTHLTLPTILLV